MRTRATAFVIAAAIVAMVSLAGCKRHEMTEAEREKIIEDKKKNANWGKSINDAQRMEEISRQRAQAQRDQAAAKQ